MGLLRLGEPASQDPAVAGTKAATLARLLSLFPDRVPPGWVLPAAQGATLLDAKGGAERKALESLRSDLQGELGSAIAASYAVRSSGLDEDSPDHSFAGQYKTVLAVSGADALADAVRDCVRSCSGPRIDAYRRRAGELGMQAPAVLLQEMIPAERAGVAFTSNPVSDAEETVIDAGYGLGDLVVGGEITPDEFGVDDSGDVVWEKLGSKQRMSVLTAEGVTRIPIPDALRRQSSLSKEQLAAIKDTAALCRSEMGYAADIEWAIANGTVYVLQARPIVGKRQRT